MKRFQYHEIESFRGAIAQHLGLRIDTDKFPFLEELLEARISKTGANDTAAYLEDKVTRQTEIGELARRLSVGETYFFRNIEQFHALDAVLRARAMSQQRRLRVLSAGCSSGEEPYSIAIVVRETLPDASRRDLSIVGVDVNPDAMERACAGRYSSWSMREAPDGIRSKYFQQRDTQYIIDASIREMVRFEQRNLIPHDPSLWRPEAFDVIFCRNVLMYFTPESIEEMISRIVTALSPGGLLFLGHAENLRGICRELHLHHSHGTFYYEKRSGLKGSTLPGGKTGRPPLPAHRPAPQVGVPPSNDLAWIEGIARSSSHIETLMQQPNRKRPGVPIIPQEFCRQEHDEHNARGAGLAPSMDLLKQERFQDALALLAASFGAGDRDPDAMLLEAVLLLSNGDAATAEKVCVELLEIDGLNAGAHYVIALCREHAGDRRGAIEHDQIACYLDPDFAMPYLHLGLLARRSGDAAAARRNLALARGLLSREDAARIVLFGGGFKRDALIEICRTELNACGGPS